MIQWNHVRAYSAPTNCDRWMERSHRWSYIDHVEPIWSVLMDVETFKKKFKSFFFIVKLDWRSCISELYMLWCCGMLIQFNKQCVNLSEWLRDTLWPSPKWHTFVILTFKRVFIPHSQLLLNNPCRITSKEKCKCIWDLEVQGTGFRRFLGFNPLSTPTLMFCNSLMLDSAEHQLKFLFIPCHFSACDKLLSIKTQDEDCIVYWMCIITAEDKYTHSIFTICVSSGILTVLHPTTKNCPFHKKTCKGTLFFT